ncbi:hypothetical protein PRIPAC_85267 [Pristionchus pacificus]|uniref:Uncharacterized protein n=1 Tax=Pristionchus pacificus TaxID=54126 RepID=A0A2A6BUS7_PRIPA|nr:hypothetical protein PRIPAC_85267 [Pristionchus pacificus]|eukprot:PDM69511.1 hypothetical protein PRIPAC_44607 [Pristionchus pacificus]
MAAATTQRTTSTGGYENYRRLIAEEEEEEGEYTPRCCCCDSMDYVRYFGIVATVLSLAALRMRMIEAIEDSLIMVDFTTLLTDYMIWHLAALLLCTLSMGCVAVAFKNKLGKWLYGPILMHIVIFIINLYIGFTTVFFQTAGDKLARKAFKHRLDDLAFDHPHATYEELHAYLLSRIVYEVGLSGAITFAQVPLHMVCVVVCWRLRSHLEGQWYLQKQRNDREAKRKADKAKVQGASLSHGEAEGLLSREEEEIEMMEEEAKKSDYKMEIIWRNVAFFAFLHLGAIYGLILALTSASWKSAAWVMVVTLYSGNCVTAGAHRLWTHKAYKHDVIDWARDHRTHHKWTDSDAHPHNSKRGFFFSHIGWLMVKKHPKVIEMGRKIDLTDLKSDPVLAFQRRYYYFLCFLSILFTVLVPVYFWNESLLINSAAHKFGSKAFDKGISATDSFFWAIRTNGEAWHNYHHALPQDYRASKYAWSANMSAAMIDFFAYMGWVWDRKTMSTEAYKSSPIPPPRQSLTRSPLTSRAPLTSREPLRRSRAMPNTRTDGAMSAGALENYRRMLAEEEDDDGEYVPRCCCCDSMTYVRVFGIFSTLLALYGTRARMAKAVEEALLISDFWKLFLDHLVTQAIILSFCTVSMVLAAIAFKFKRGKLLYAPILLHGVVVCCLLYSAIELILFHSLSNTLAKMIFKSKLDDLAVDHPDRSYEELHAYLMQVIGREVATAGIITAFTIPFHLTFIVVCWRLRSHLEQQRYLGNQREARETKRIAEKAKKC